MITTRPMVHSTEQGLKLQLLAVTLIAALVFLHYLLWIDENGVRQTHTLRIGIQAQTEENAELAERNRALAAEIEDLKRGLMAIEERARSDMGMIRPDETFYHLLDKPQPATPKLSTPSKPASPVDRPASAVKPKSPAKPPAPAPAAKLAPPAKPTAPAPAAKTVSPAKSSAQAARPAPPKPPAPAPTPKPTPPVKPQTPAVKPTSPAKPSTQPPKPTPTPGVPQRRE